MEQHNAVKTLPRIPDFYSMPKTLATYKLSHKGREETAEIRRKFLSAKTGSQKDEIAEAIFLRRSNGDVNQRSAPAGSRCKDSPRTSLGHLTFYSKSRLRKTNEEKAKLRAKEYIAKQIYKIPTCQRPAFFIKVHVDPRPPFPYPQGTLPSSNCHFSYVKPTKSTEDKYNDLIEKSADINSSSKPEHLTSTEKHKRNKIVEELLSLSRPEDSNEVINSEETTKTPTNNRIHSSSSILSSAKSRSNNVKRESQKETLPNESIKQRKSKSVGFSLPPSYKQNKDPKTSLRRSGSCVVNWERNSQSTDPFRNSIPTRNGLSRGAIASAHARYHFIHPEWPSEFISWARHSHPTTDEQFRYSFI